MAINSCNAVMGKHLVAGSLSGELKVADAGDGYWAGGAALDAALDALSAGLKAEEGARASAVTAEASARSAADATLQGNIDSEEAARIAADAAASALADDRFDGIITQLGLSGSAHAASFAAATTDRAAIRSEMAANETARDASDEVIRAALQADVDQNESDADAAIAAEATARGAAVSAEASARAGADAALQAELDATQANLDEAGGFNASSDAVAGSYMLDWGTGKPRMQMSIDAAGAVDVCFSVVA